MILPLKNGVPDCAGLKTVDLTGIAAVAPDGRLWVLVPRSWKGDAKNETELLSCDPKAREWGAVPYPLEAVDGEGGWVGLAAWR